VLNNLRVVRWVVNRSMVGASQKPGVVPIGLILGEAEGLEVKTVNVV
jgi:hypothetical protein